MPDLKRSSLSTPEALVLEVTSAAGGIWCDFLNPPHPGLELVAGRIRLREPGAGRWVARMQEEGLEVDLEPRPPPGQDKPT